MATNDKLIIARYKPTGQEQTMLYQTFTALKNPDDWEYLRDAAAPAPTQTVATPPPVGRVSQPKKRGCGCKK